MITRSSLARYLVDTPAIDRPAAIQHVAAWLVQYGRKREARYVVQDVAKFMQDRGSVWAKVTVAHTLDTRSTKGIEHYINEMTGCKEVMLDVVIDPDMVGGVRIETPQGAIDASLKSKLSEFIARSTKNA